MISFPKRERAQRAAACVGVDAGWFSHTLVVRPHGRPDSKPFSFPTTRTGFDSAVAFLRQQSGGAAPDTMLVGIEFAGSYRLTLTSVVGIQVYMKLGATPSQFVRVGGAPRVGPIPVVGPCSTAPGVERTCKFLPVPP
jgi:hypothetical protein